ncbi:MAG TPA: sulfatase [Thermoanaerobaculia bacterium]|jgi:arylsulfatase A-like enzyme|nr:sulfatase [Thermoanaerobaculia bacterium]
MRFRALLLVAAVAMAAVAGTLAACRPDAAVAANAPRRIFLITVDTLRADHTSLYGYPRQTTPRLDALAPTGVLFADVVAQWPKTGASFASMFTGRYPQTTGMMQKAALRIPSSYETLPEMLHEAGYRTGAVVSNAVLGAKLGWDSGFDEYLQTWGKGDFPTDVEQFRDLVHAPRVNALALPLLDRHARDERLFVWIHYTDPHAPYVLPAGEANPFLADAHFTGGEQVPRHVARVYQLGAQRERRYYVAQYDANVRIADRAIGELLDHARRLGLLDDALVIFAADHGESLGEHGSWFEHGPLPYNTTARVPLLVFGKGVPAGRRVERPVELVDLYPTLRDLVAPRREVHGLEGHSLVPWLQPKAPLETVASEFRFSYSEAGERPHYFRSVQDGAWKLVQGFGRRGHQAGAPGGWELYDLAADPAETVNLAESKSGELRRLRAALLRWARTGAERRPAQETGGDEDAEKALHALGYAN